MRLFSFGGLRVIVRAAKALERIATAQERMADALEGHPREVPVVDAPKDTGVTYLNPVEHARVLDWEDRLRGVLKRDPTPEEIVEQIEAEDAVMRGR